MSLLTFTYATLHTFLHYAGDFLRLELFTDLTKANKSLTFDDILDAEITIFDYIETQVLHKATGRVYADGILVYDNGVVVINTSPDFSYDSSDRKTRIDIHTGETVNFTPGAYTLKLVLRFKTEDELTFVYKDALQVMRNI